ncbi:MAG: hypothetical protein KTR25_01425 [Myxococcales bacterium]|nr:hypothetical protein [Myxococcales bacterium]
MSGVAGILVLGGVVANPHLVASLPPQTVQKWLQVQMDGHGAFPSLASVQIAAERTVVGFAYRAGKWAARSRQRSWLPRVDVRLGTDSDIDVRGSGQEDQRWTEARGFGVDVVLRWGLSDLVFSEREIQVHRELRARSTLVHRLRQRVTELYVQRLEVAWTLKTHPEPPIDLLLRAIRLDGLLMAATGGKWRVQR